MKSSELHRLIKKNGWRLARVKGSHYIYEKNGRTYPAPYHGSDEVGKGIEKTIKKRNEFKMKTIKVILERSKDAFWANSENTQVNGVGDTVEEVKQSVLDCVEIQKELGNLKADEEYNIVYKFDTESLLQHYKGIFTNAAFERLTGINQLQVSHYATGLKKPRPAQVKKIENALHKLGNELIAIEL